MHNPLDEQGFQQIEPGDFVAVKGRFDDDFFEKRKFDAESINKLIE